MKLDNQDQKKDDDEQIEVIDEVRPIKEKSIFSFCCVSSEIIDSDNDEEQIEMKKISDPEFLKGIPDLEEKENKKCIII